MAGVWLISLLFLYFCAVFVTAEECVVYDFENGFDSLFNFDRNVCAAVGRSWSVGNYSQNGIASPNSHSETFLFPSSGLSCTSSFEFSMSAGGVVEVSVYIDSSATNQITILANQVVSGGNDAVVGIITILPNDPSFVSGWQKVRTGGLLSTGTFQGYISIMGMASDDYSVMVDSFRYIPPNYNENSCVVYETEEQETTTQRTDGIEDCMTYNFETDFEIKFSTDNYLCDGFLPWHLENYTSIDVESPNAESTVFMTPNEVSSCISSFVFNMTPEGIVEANIYMDTVTALDHIIVLAQKKTEKEYDTVAGFQMYYPENQVFVTGWNVLRFSLLDFTSFEGYLIFIGSAEKGSTVLVDSVRYIPPQTPPNDYSCALYSTNDNAK